MHPSGIIYQSSRSRKSGEVRLTLGLGRRVLYHLLRGVGGGMITFALAALIFSVYPIVKEEFLYHFGTKEDVQINKFADIIGKSQAETLGLNPYFSIFIPKINAKANIIPNVNAGIPGDYLEALTRGVAHAAGTNFPGQGKTIFLFSHSTDTPLNFARYNAIFYLLRKLERGDRVIIYFMATRYEYVIMDKIITTADDTSWLKDDGSGLPAGRQGERLILQTCDPPGTSWNRLLVIARPVGVINN